MKKLINFFRLWPELWSLPLALLTFLVSPLVLHWLDPTAASYDVGIFQILLFAAIAMLAFNSLVWLGIKFNFRELYNYYTIQFSKDFSNLSPWERVKSLLSVYLGLLLALVLLARVL